MIRVANPMPRMFGNTYTLPIHGPNESDGSSLAINLAVPTGLAIRKCDERNRQFGVIRTLQEPRNRPLQ